jgi:hypothetical protein
MLPVAAASGPNTDKRVFLSADVDWTLLLTLMFMLLVIAAAAYIKRRKLGCGRGFR